MDLGLAGDSSSADHLCVLVHGLWGNPLHLKNVAKVLREKYGEDKLHILVAKKNSGSFTYDGIELGGERVCQEIEEELEKLSNGGQTIKKLSIVGYSLGGLVARYAVGLLESKGVFEKIEPFNFTTIASPHLGVRSPLRSWSNTIFNILGARTLSMSGRQLFMIDNFRDTGRPLLAVLADPNSIFIRGLKRFRRRSLYTNIVNDLTATFYTTSISKIDPFVDLNNVKLNYLEHYEDVILDGENSVLPTEKVQLTFHRQFTHKVSNIISNLPLFVAMIFLIPIGTLAFLINSGIQTISSSRRIRLHESGQAGIDLSSYRMPFLTDIREAVEDVYENLNNFQNQEYLSVDIDDVETLQGDSIAHEESSMAKGGTERSSFSDVPMKANPHHVEAPILALTSDQFAMIRILDSVGWRKHPVHIHKVRHSHAAIIVRMDKPGFSEGYVVLRHWLEEEFLME